MITFQLILAPVPTSWSRYCSSSNLAQNIVLLVRCKCY